MDNLNQIVVSAWADVDFEIGDAVYFNFLNGAIIDPPGIHAIKTLASGGVSFRTMHGVAVTSAKAAHDNFPPELVTVLLTTSGVVSAKCDWDTPLTPGTGIYPPKHTDGTMTAESNPTIPHNLLGHYVGTETLPVSQSGSRINILILRLAPQIATG